MRRDNTLALALSAIALTAILAAPALLPIAFAGSSGGTKGVVDPATNGFRVSLTSLTPVTTADVASGTALYLCTYTSDRIALWSGSEWNVIEAGAEPSLSLSGMTADTNYDVFVYNSSGTITFDTLVAWTNNTTRATTLDEQDGVRTKGGDRTRRYIATVRATGAAAVDDTDVARFVFNAANRVPRRLRVVEATNSWTYSLAAFQSARASDANRVSFVRGLNVEPVFAQVSAIAENSGTAADMVTGIGLDTSGSNSATEITPSTSATAGKFLPTFSFYRGYPVAGSHFFQWLEAATASGTTTWYGDAGDATKYQSGLTGVVWQ